jgi:cytochrome b pre-mRNA-processing protein 3
MNNDYINIYNNLVNLARNKNLYKIFTNQDTFSDRLIVLLFHFAFFLKIYSKNNKKNTLQNIYDHFFKQLELSIREIGYGDVTINKKMKNYINIFHSLLEKIESWENIEKTKKNTIINSYLNINDKSHKLTEYFDNFHKNLTNNSLNSFAKGVIKT